MEARIRALERQIATVKRELADVGDLHPGSLSEQYNVCGTPGCGCKESPSKRHGPYHQLSFSLKGKSSSRFVRRENVATVKKQLRNYARLRKLVDRWITLATELSELRIDQQKASRSGRRSTRKTDNKRTRT